MGPTMPRILYWTPRLLAILFAAFLSLFSLDAFELGSGPWTTVSALVIHLIPTTLLVLALVITWRWERVGAWLFFSLALFLVAAFGRGSELITYWYLLQLAAPLVLIGVLFLADARYKSWLRTKG
jgi:hypothetical protein